MDSTYTQSAAPHSTASMQYSAPVMAHGSFSPAPDYEASQMTASHSVSVPQTQVLQPWGQSQQMPQQMPQPMPQPMPHGMPQQIPQHMMPEKTFTQVHQMPIQPSPYRQAIPLQALNMASAPVDCPGCGQRQMTAISYHAGSSTHLWAGILCLFTGIFCFIPYLMQSMKDVQHNCGHCGRMLATWHKGSGTQVHAWA